MSKAGRTPFDTGCTPLVPTALFTEGSSLVVLTFVDPVTMKSTVTGDITMTPPNTVNGYVEFNPYTWNIYLQNAAAGANTLTYDGISIEDTLTKLPVCGFTVNDN